MQAVRREVGMHIEFLLEEESAEEAPDWYNAP